MEQIILTEQGKKELEQRLKELRNEIIPQVVQRIKTAREQGDLSENAEYHSAKDEQGRLEGEAREIEEKLKHGVVVVAKQDGSIQIGTQVRYLDIDEEEEFTLTLVGTAEADFTKNKISVESPVGQAIINKKAGDVVNVKMAKGGEYQIKILEIIE